MYISSNLEIDEPPNRYIHIIEDFFQF